MRLNFMLPKIKSARRGLISVVSWLLISEMTKYPPPSLSRDAVHYKKHEACRPREPRFSFLITKAKRQNNPISSETEPLVKTQQNKDNSHEILKTANISNFQPILDHEGKGVLWCVAVQIQLISTYLWTFSMNTNFVLESIEALLYGDLFAFDARTHAHTHTRTENTSTRIRWALADEAVLN